MRISIAFKPERNIFLLPTNYNYELSSMIYYIMSLSGPKFSNWLHSRGFSLDGGKRFKFFNFSRLFFHEKEIQGDVIKASGNFKLIFSTPIDESVLTNFVSGIMENSEGLYLGNKQVGTKVKIVRVNILPYPRFEHNTKYIMLSPTVASIKNNQDRVIYLDPSDSRTIEVLRNNIVRKYEAIYREKCPYAIDIAFDEEYLSKKGDVSEVMRLINVKVGKANSAKIKGFLLPLYIQSDETIHRLIYDAGLGEKNSLGFGMLEVAK
ncbi:MAG TPA: CRISPR-associated endoribonuclease Cas6 [Candidatus Kapabacteria bacterium]|jgi:CRISPR-associated endoribonuclease Cas6|nr:CRISPR-associated endoribonuclease Cas6 [Candidatus Kapabacteria bacterium]HOQ48522.1 CRISPR-associated endoribonuclease Cas6 [Candidatus Kapabacteria bacterium]HPP39895.1 CRISPR-associated endoribonuclease Cas6 [Candidatus Kapabacteria bacterium]HPU22975.1 CRISPR-associated endoribonuclease Cas6 [Candidatus Kapabacteria bacterium]